MVAEDITQLLERWRAGDSASRDEVCERLYGLLHEMAYARIRGRGHRESTLQPTMLVHDALLRMIGGEARYLDRAHFLSLAALKMRAVLVDHARMKAAAKRGGDAVSLTLSHADSIEAADDGVDILALHQALEQLAEYDPRAAQAVEKSYFGGMSHAEIAEVLSVSVPTVERDLRFARAWLNRALSA